MEFVIIYRKYWSVIDLFKSFFFLFIRYLTFFDEVIEEGSAIKESWMLDDY